MHFIIDQIWEISKKQILEQALKKVGLASINPLYKMGYYFLDKFLDKYVKPEFDKVVANQNKVYRKHIEKIKLKKLNEAIDEMDRDVTVDVIDTLH